MNQYLNKLINIRTVIDLKYTITKRKVKNPINVYEQISYFINIVRNND